MAKASETRLSGCIHAAKLIAWALFPLLISGCQSSPPAAQRPVTWTAYQPAELGESETALVAAQGFPAEQVAFLVQKVKEGAPLASARAEVPAVPASVTKLVTGLAALDVLGPRHHFRTQLLATGSLKNGVWIGDLILKGGGDPLLFMSHLMDFAFALKRQGIQSVRGRFWYDDSYFPARAVVGDLSGTEASAYNPGVSALSLEFNRIPLRRQAASGPQVWPGFPMPGWQFSSGDAGRRAVWQGELVSGQETWRLSEKFFSEGKTDLPVKRSSLWTARVLRELCRIQGITLPEPAAGPAPKTTRLLAEHVSPPLVDIVEGAWEYSNNLVAEILAEQVRRERGQDLVQWASARYPRLSWAGARLVNGSGLTTQNRLSPAQLVGLLGQVAGRHYGDRTLPTLLPISGWKGTLRDLHFDPETGYRVWAKTGTLSYHRALAGYLFSDRGTTLAFAILIGDSAGRDRYEAATDREAAQNAEREWLDRAKRLENQLLTFWLRKY